jgi:nucleoside-diphosphate-sugar epimerase
MNRILIIGCGDIAIRIARLLHPRYRIFGLIRDPAHRAKLRSAGIVPLIGDLDNRSSLQRLAGLADTVLHLAPPPSSERVTGIPLADSNSPDRMNVTDIRTRNLIAALSTGQLPRRIIYISTSGVYGDCKGEIVSETRPVNAQNPRAKFRVDAENQIRYWAKRCNVHASILRVPGIYAAERLPLERLKKSTPAIVDAEDGYTNHIHADDLARCILAALEHAKSNRIYHVVDDSNMKMGEYFDAVADAFGFPHPPRVTREEAQKVLSPMLLSFMNESRRLTNKRIKQELKFTLHYPTVADALTGFSRHCLSEPVAQVSALPHQTQLSLPLS